MPIAPIHLTLSPYNKLSILRKQLEDRTREFEEIEATIRETLLYIKEVDYLKAISPAYANLDATEQINQISTLETRRTMLYDLLGILNEMLIKTEHEAKSGGNVDTTNRAIEKNTIGSASSATATKPADKKPLSFDEFKKKFPSSGV